MVDALFPKVVKPPAGLLLDHFSRSYLKRSETWSRTPSHCRYACIGSGQRCGLDLWTDCVEQPNWRPCVYLAAVPQHRRPSPQRRQREQPAVWTRYPTLESKRTISWVGGSVLDLSEQVERRKVGFGAAHPRLASGLTMGLAADHDGRRKLGESFGGYIECDNLVVG